MRPRTLLSPTKRLRCAGRPTRPEPDSPPFLWVRSSAPPPPDEHPSTPGLRVALRAHAATRALTFRPRGFPPPRRLAPDAASSMLQLVRSWGLVRFRSRTRQLIAQPRPRHLSRTTVHTPRRIPLDGSRTASLRPLPSCRSCLHDPRGVVPCRECRGRDRQLTHAQARAPLHLGVMPESRRRTSTTTHRVSLAVRRTTPCSRRTCRSHRGAIKRRNTQNVLHRSGDRRADRRGRTQR